MNAARTLGVPFQMSVATLQPLKRFWRMELPRTFEAWVVFAFRPSQSNTRCVCCLSFVLPASRDVACLGLSSIASVPKSEHRKLQKTINYKRLPVPGGEAADGTPNGQWDKRTIDK